jgi:alginate O-acetyltransferase complex protein AlgI
MGLVASLLDIKFVLFLGLVGLLRAFWPSKHYIFFGALSSALLIGLAAPTTLVVIAVITILYLYPLARLMVKADQCGWSRGVTALLLFGGIFGLVALLLVFKLYRHFTVPWLGGPWLSTEVLALIGFSYFMFRAISFLHIQSILRMKVNPLGLLYYTLFPPTIASGPIQKYQDFQQQLAAPEPLNSSLLCTAAYRVTRGYFRKVVLAVGLNQTVEKLLAIAHPTIWVSLMIVALLYLFFYFDFAGYSDIAIGFGLLIGIRVPENFRKPFQATTVSEFWRNYHITLVDWFRDQVFIPLGGMQGSRFRAGTIALLIMLLCGLWHGLTLAFLAWGLWHGMMLFTEAVLGSKPVLPSLRHGLKYWGRVLWTNGRVAIGAVLFLPDSATTLRVLQGFVHWGL